MNLIVFNDAHFAYYEIHSDDMMISVTPSRDQLTCPVFTFQSKVTSGPRWPALSYGLYGKSISPEIPSNSMWVRVAKQAPRVE
jgi:hypothetical protein